MWLSAERPDLTIRQKHSKRTQGFTLIEILIGITILVVGVLGVATMFGTGFSNVGEGARLTMAVTASRQILEDVRTIPFNNLVNLNGFNTGASGTQPAADPEKNIARKWRYALAGEDTANGWTFTSAEKANWQNLGVGNGGFGGRGSIVVTSPSATMRQITITVFAPGRANPNRTQLTTPTVQLVTLISRL